MRIWSLHPVHLDAKGLVALWREALLAKHVLQGNTKGYKHHPQLHRFKNHPNPLGAIHFYLHTVYQEGMKRGYNFDRSKFILSSGSTPKINVNAQQVQFERVHLYNKLLERTPNELNRANIFVSLHPLFIEVPGPIEDWEVL